MWTFLQESSQVESVVLIPTSLEKRLLGLTWQCVSFLAGGGGVPYTHSSLLFFSAVGTNVFLSSLALKPRDERSVSQQRMHDSFHLLGDITFLVPQFP
jgi:hypothetical protein